MKSDTKKALIVSSLLALGIAYYEYTNYENSQQQTTNSTLTPSTSGQQPIYINIQPPSSSSVVYATPTATNSTGSTTSGSSDTSGGGSGGSGGSGSSGTSGGSGSTQPVIHLTLSSGNPNNEGIIGTTTGKSAGFTPSIVQQSSGGFTIGDSAQPFGSAGASAVSHLPVVSSTGSSSSSPTTFKTTSSTTSSPTLIGMISSLFGG
jgi:hypothetical protein